MLFCMVLFVVLHGPVAILFLMVLKIVLHGGVHHFAWCCRFLYGVEYCLHGVGCCRR